MLMNKYVEGYLLCWYYGGCDYVDWIEVFVIDCVCVLFDVSYVNV